MFFPEQLSLPHIRRVSIRNIYAKSMGELLSSMPPGSIGDWKSIALNGFEWYFELHEELKPTLLYRSDYASNTLNPEWEMPSEFAKDAKLCKHRKIRFIVYFRRRTDKNRSSSKPDEVAGTEYPETCNIQEEDIVFEEAIDMKALLPLNLKSLVSFNRLPINTYAFQLGQCGYFVSPKFAKVLSASSGLTLVQPEMTANIKELEKPQIRYVLGSMIETEKIIEQTRVERASLQKQIETLLSKFMGNKPDNSFDEALNTDAAILQQKKSNDALKVLLEEMEQAYQLEKKKVDEDSKKISERFQALKRNRDEYKEKYVQLKVANGGQGSNLVSPENIDLDVGSKVNNRSHVNGRKSINSLREELADVMFKCKIREIKIIVELKKIYPIAALTGHREYMYSIRGLQLPGTDLRSYEEDQISTALGYICHLVSLISDFFDINLRYEPVHRGSRSFMRDNFAANHITPTMGANVNSMGVILEYPLYWSGVDRSRFDTAVKYLDHNIDHILSKSNVILQNPRTHMLAKLLRLYDSQLGL